VIRLKGDRRHTRAVQRLLAQEVADGRITTTSTAVVIDDPAPLVLLEKALDAAYPSWRDDPMQYQVLFSGPVRRRPDWLLVLHLRAKACGALNVDPRLT